jgi:hypothetical protein
MRCFKILELILKETLLAGRVNYVACDRIPIQMPLYLLFHAGELEAKRGRPPRSAGRLFKKTPVGLIAMGHNHRKSASCHAPHWSFRYLIQL